MIIFCEADKMFYINENQQAIFPLRFEFPLSVNVTDLRNKPMGFTDWHWHEELQFSYVLEGGMITSALGQECLLRPGDAFFIGSNISHMTRPSSPASARYFSFNFHPNLLTLYRGSVIEQKYFFPYINHPDLQFVHLTPDTPWQEHILTTLRILFQTLSEQPFAYELEVYSDLLSIWKTLLEHLTDRTHTHYLTMERPEAQQIMAYLRENYRTPITLRAVAKHMHLSREECCRLFKAAYSCTIFTYLADYRLQQSLPLLADRSLTVSQIAERCGFNSTSYFIKRFREKVGVSPLQYRKNLDPGSEVNGKSII